MPYATGIASFLLLLQSYVSDMFTALFTVLYVLFYDTKPQNIVTLIK
jgi:hypothetical protein